MPKTKMDDEIIQRLERLEEAVTTLGANWGYGDSALRKETQGKLREVIQDTRVRVEQRIEDATLRCQFTGANEDAVNEFAGEDGLVRTDEQGSKWLVGNNVDGRSIPLRPGMWLAKDPRTCTIYITQPIAGVI
ncbi:MAG: hypothetical protein ACXVH1_18320 [Solirubrobacteraceae bacterium]